IAIVGRWNLVEIDCGSNGRVYYAQNLETKCGHALKELFCGGKKPAEVDISETVSILGSQFLGRIDLAGYVTAVGAFKISRWCIVQEFYATDLHHFIQRKALADHSIGWRTCFVKHCAYQILSGLAALQDKGIVYHDLKPENVMVDKTHLRLIDYSNSFREGGSRVVGGAPEYLAPEQLIAGVRGSHKADVFALGLLLLEVYSGESFFPPALSVEIRSPHSARIDVAIAYHSVLLSSLIAENPTWRIQPSTSGSKRTRDVRSRVLAVFPEAEDMVFGAVYKRRRVRLEYPSFSLFLRSVFREEPARPSFREALRDPWFQMYKAK
ncbi:hypothetical protein KC355_g16651, partial [Hortaea werneckii]